MEEWKPCVGFELFYEVSNTGFMRRKQIPVVDKNGNSRSFSQRILKPQKDRKGYLRVRITYLNHKYSVKVHRAVALTFIPNPDNKPQVNHKDTDKSNNHIDNLEWMTNEENMRHAFASGAYIERDKTTILNIKHMKKHYVDKTKALSGESGR